MREVNLTNFWLIQWTNFLSLLIHHHMFVIRWLILFLSIKKLQSINAFSHANFREDTKVSHYIINKIQQNDQIVFRIGDQQFSDLPELLAFYKLHYLDTTPLRRPATRKIEKVIAKFDFDGSVSILSHFWCMLWSLLLYQFKLIMLLSKLHSFSLNWQ